MEERCLDVILLYVPIEGGSEVQQGAKGLEARGRRGGFVVVHPVLLSVARCDIAHLIMRDVTSAVALVFAHEFAFQQTMARWDMGSRDQNEDVEVF
jgi:hypothetical protein